MKLSTLPEMVQQNNNRTRWFSIYLKENYKYVCSSCIELAGTQNAEQGNGYKPQSSQLWDGRYRSCSCSHTTLYHALLTYSGWSGAAGPDPTDGSWLNPTGYLYESKKKQQPFFAQLQKAERTALTNVQGLTQASVEDGQCTVSQSHKHSSFNVAVKTKMAIKHQAATVHACLTFLLLQH